jgi:hypothetical protein
VKEQEKEAAMRKPHVEDHRRIKLEKIENPDYIPFLEGRPEREKVIRNEDILDLRIAMNTSKSLEDFLNQI